MKPTLFNSDRDILSTRNSDLFGLIDYVPLSLPISYGRAEIYLLEDTDAVMKITIKQRSAQMRHVARTHRVDLDWLFERLTRDLNAYLKFVGTREQLADILTKGSFTGETLVTLCELCLIMPLSKFSLTSNSELFAEIKPVGTKPQANIAFLSSRRPSETTIKTLRES